MANQQNILDTSIEYVKGIGPARGETFRKELNIHTVYDLLFTFPFRYIDRTTFHLIKDIHTDGDNIQLKGTLVSLKKVKSKSNRSRLTGMFKDSTGFLELVWFQGATWLDKTLKVGEEYIVYGRVTIFSGKKTIAHPEMELISDAVVSIAKKFNLVYSSTEKIDCKGRNSKAR